MKTKLDKITNKRLKVARMRDLLNQLYDNQISFSRMVEIINDESGRLLLKELTDEDLDKLHKVANKFIVKGLDGKHFISRYGVLQILDSYLDSLNSN